MSAVMQAIQATGGTLTGTMRAMSVVFPPRCCIVRSASLNFTRLVHYSLIMWGTTFYGMTDGLPVIDALGFYLSDIIGITIYGDPALPPSYGMQVGTITGTGANGLNSVSYFDMDGYYTKAPLMNHGAETTTWMKGTFQNLYPGGWAWIGDGQHSAKWALTSQWVTVTTPTGAGYSFSLNNFISCRFRSEASPESNCIWLAHAVGFSFLQGTYTVTEGTTLWFDCTGGRSRDFHFDGTMDGPPSRIVYLEIGEKSTQIAGFVLHLADTLLTGTSVFSTNATLPGRVKIDALDFRTHALNGGIMWENPEVWWSNGQIALLDAIDPTQGGTYVDLPDRWTGIVRVPEMGDRLYDTSIIGTAQIVDGPAGTNRIMWFTTDKVERWDIRATNDPETGANAGSDFIIMAHDDAGTQLWVTRQNRDTGEWIFPEAVTLPGVVAKGSFVNDAAAAGGGVLVGELYRNGSALMIRVA